MGKGEGEVDDSLFQGKDTVDEILATRDTALNVIYVKKRGLRTAIEEMKDAAYDRPLTPQERRAITDYRELISALSEAVIELDLLTLRVLHESSEVKRMVNVLTAVNHDIRDKIASIKRVSQFIKSIGDVIGTIDNLITAMTKLSGLL